MNLNGYSLPQLRQLQVRLMREIAKRDTSKKEELLKQFDKLARAQGLSLSEVLGVREAGTPRLRLERKTPKPVREPLPPRYCHPADRSLTWSGRGRQPMWMTTFLQNGGTTSALEEAARKALMQSSAKQTKLKAVSGSTAARPLTPEAADSTETESVES